MLGIKTEGVKEEWHCGRRFDHEYGGGHETLGLCYIWFPENTKERKKLQRKMIFLCLVVL